MNGIPFPNRQANKLVGSYYPLQKEELMALKQAKLINNTAYVHFALRYENPFCDRPIEIVPKEFALRWAIPESSVYAAVAKLRELGTIRIKSGKIVIEWSHSQQERIIDCQQEGVSRNLEFFSDPRKISQPLEKILESQKNFSDPRKNSEILENRAWEPSENKASSFSQTLQTIQTHQTNQSEVEGVENFFWEEDPWDNQEETIGQAGGSQEQKLEVRQQEVKAKKENLKEGKSQEPKLPAKKRLSRAESSQNFTIPPDLVTKLEELSIPLDAQVKKAIASHDISQAYGAAAHVEKTWETINNPRSVFLYQLPKQPIEKQPPSPFTPEFLDWYEQAIAEGLVEDRPPECLPRDSHNEPRVFLKDGRLFRWRQVRDNPPEPVLSPEEAKVFFERIRQQFGRKRT